MYFDTVPRNIFFWPALIEPTWIGSYLKQPINLCDVFYNQTHVLICFDIFLWFTVWNCDVQRRDLRLFKTHHIKSGINVTFWHKLKFSFLKRSINWPKRSFIPDLNRNNCTHMAKFRVPPNRVFFNMHNMKCLLKKNALINRTVIEYFLF